MTSIIVQENISFVLKKQVNYVVIIILSCQVKSCDIVMATDCIQVYKVRVLSFRCKPTLLRLVSSNV